MFFYVRNFFKEKSYFIELILEFFVKNPTLHLLTIYLKLLTMLLKNEQLKWISLLFFFLWGLCIGLLIEEWYQFIGKRTNISINHSGSIEKEWFLSDLLYSESFSTIISWRVREAYDIIAANYYHFSEHQKNEIENGIIAGLVKSLEDKHSTFFSIDESKQFHETLSGDFEGIGAVIDEHPQWVVVDRVIAWSPAKESGITAGDIILKVDSTLIGGMKVQDAVKLIRWKANTIVKLLIFRAWAGVPYEKTITRKKITIPSVEGSVLSGSTLGYIALSIFGENTGKEFSQELDNLLTQKVPGIIIDLRDNGGGFLDVATEILSRFVERDKWVVIIKENDPRKTETLFSKGTAIVKTPIVLLLNENSASASEIVAWALKDYNLAILVGNKSYGKWSVQQPFPLSDGSELKITVARWYTPLDKGIDGIGIEPDISIDFEKEDFEKRYDRQLETAQSILTDWIQTKNSKTTIDTFLKKEIIRKQLLLSGSTLTGTISTASWSTGSSLPHN